MLPQFLLLTTLLAAATGTFATPTAPLEKRCIDCPWIGWYEDPYTDCISHHHHGPSLEINNEERFDFQRPANTSVGVHFGSGIGYAGSISAFTDKAGSKGAHNFDNKGNIFLCYNDTSDRAWSIPWLSARAAGSS